MIIDPLNIDNIMSEIEVVKGANRIPLLMTVTVTIKDIKGESLGHARDREIENLKNESLEEIQIQIVHKDPVIDVCFL